MPNETLEAVRRDYQVFTAIEQQLKDGLLTKIDQSGTIKDVWEAHKNSVVPVLLAIEQHKADLFAKYNI